MSARLVVRRPASAATSLGRAALRLPTATRGSLRVRPSSTGRRTLARLARRSTRLRLELTVRDAAGNARRVVSSLVVRR